MSMGRGLGECLHMSYAKNLQNKQSQQYDDQGIKCIDNKEINSCFSKFYQLLYTSDLTTDPSEVGDFFKARKYHL